MKRFKKRTMRTLSKRIRHKPRTQSVKVYSVPDCLLCAKTKELLKEKGVSFQDIDISKDTKAMEDLRRKTHQTGVPVVEVGNKTFVGFDRTELEKAF